MSVLNENVIKKSLMQQKKYSDNLDLALCRIEQHPSCRFGRGAMRQYRDGYWPAMDADVFRHLVLETPEQAERGGKVRITSLRLRSVMEPIKQKTAHPADQWDASPNILVTRNGTLDLESLTLREHSPEDYALSALDYTFARGATPAADARALSDTVYRAGGQPDVPAGMRHTGAVSGRALRARERLPHFGSGTLQRLSRLVLGPRLPAYV